LRAFAEPVEVPMRRLLVCLLLVCPLVAVASVPAEASTSLVPACKTPPRGRVSCDAIRLDRYSSGRLRHASAPVGLTPADLQSAYALPSSTAGTGETVAIVDAYDDPHAEADLAVYRREFGLPPCTTGNGCFRKVDQNGGHAYPATDAGWSEEISLDLDMASAVCPRCHLLLVEAASASQGNLGVAVNTAARLGASAISNSYGGADASDATYGRYYHHPGVAITASAGDSGYGVSYPASSKWVTAVGGTTLRRSTRARRGWTESAWSGTGSGCSTRNTTSWQDQEMTGCPGRAMADIAAVADPATGVAVYDSDTGSSARGWLQFGGTSASAPIVAAAFALAGNTEQVADGSWLWAHHRTGLYDVRTGTNGSCPVTRWCTAHYGWDGPTGWGTPSGVGAL
jgi:subtilase family serine protease